MGVHGGGRREPDRLADLAHRRRVAVAVHVFDEELPDLLLPWGEHAAGRSASGVVVERVFAVKGSPPSGRRQLAGADRPPPERDGGHAARLLRCAGEDLNLHDRNGHKALNLARLPIPPPARAVRSGRSAGGLPA